MRKRSLGFALTALFACVAAGQTSAQPSLVQVFNFNHAETPQEMQELTTIVRIMADINVAPDIAERTVSLRGAADQIALAEWLLNQLDQPAPPSREPAAYDYQTTRRDPAVRVFRLAHIDTTGGLQEVTNAVRVISDAGKIFPYSSQNTLVMRGTADQMALAEWLVAELDGKPSQNALGHESRVPGSSDQVARVFHLAHATTGQQFQDIATQIRATAKINRISPCISQKALPVRGTAAQIVEAEELIQQLDKP